jgi:hypothetical protein
MQKVRVSGLFLLSSMIWYLNCRWYLVNNNIRYESWKREKIKDV